MHLSETMYFTNLLLQIEKIGIFALLSTSSYHMQVCGRPIVKSVLKLRISFLQQIISNILLQCTAGVFYFGQEETISKVA